MEKWESRLWTEMLTQFWWAGKVGLIRHIKPINYDLGEALKPNQHKQPIAGIIMLI